MLGLSTAITKATSLGFQYIKDGLKLYMPYKSHRADEIKFVGTGSTSFDGTNDYIDTGYTGLTVHTNATTSFWCKMGDFSGTQLMGCHNSKRFYVGFTDEKAFMGVADSYKNTTDISSYIAIDTWMHICMVAEDGTATYYIDGVARDTDTYTQSSGTNPDTNFFIGAVSPSANYYNGNICQVGIWDTALTQAQIQSIMEKTYEELTATEKTNLVSYWALDETIGDNNFVVTDKVGGSLGTELWDSATSASSDISNWSEVSSSNVTIESDDGGIKITSDGTNSYGALIYLRDSIELTTDLTVGKTYKLTHDVKVGSGDSVVVLVHANTEWAGEASAITSEEYISLTHYFIAGHITDCFLFQRAMSAGESIWLKNFSLKEVSGNNGKLL